MANDFSQKTRNRIQKHLDKKLGSEFFSVRAGYGSTKFTYVEGWKMIGLANSIFGFDGWSSEIRSITEECMEMIGDKFNVGYSCVCRVTLKNGVYKEDLGFGSADNQKVKSMAIEKAKKEAVTDALKRALRQFGNALGNCCYDREHVKNVQRPNGRDSMHTKGVLKMSDFDNKVQDNRIQDVAISFSDNEEISDLE